MKTFYEICASHALKPRGIIHVGASSCDEAEQYQEMGVPKVIWFEALPPFSHRQQRAQKFGHELFEFCPLSDRMEETKLLVSNNSVSSSILPMGRHIVLYPDIVVTETIPVHTYRMDQIYPSGLPVGFDTLVLDVQGAELKVLQGMGKLINDIQIAFIEVTVKGLYDGGPMKSDVDWFMEQAGFKNSEFHEQHLGEWGDSIYWR